MGIYRHITLTASVALAAVVGCSAARSSSSPAVSAASSNGNGTNPKGGVTAKPAAAAAAHDGARALYPDLATLYSADAGIYRTCGANQGVCHNDHEYPNFATLGALVQTIGADCNVARETPTDIHDLCERQGDKLVWGDDTMEIAGVIPKKKKPTNANAQPDNEEMDTRARLALRTAPRAKKTNKARARIVRDNPNSNALAHASAPNPTKSQPQPQPPRIELGRVALLGIVKPPRQGGGAIDIKVLYDNDDALKVSIPGLDMSGEGWGGATDPLALHLGDPNGNGVFGAELGGGLVVPGKPEKSYLITRLTDPSAGPLMPRANCCTWTKASLRALFCWVSGLSSTGDGKTNALAPIDYDHCPPGPRGAEDVAYPEPGPACETSGMCPVMPRSSVAMAGAAGGSADAATWSAVWKKVLSPNCAGGACHTDRARAVFDLKGEEAAYRSSVEHVVPRAPDKSELLIRISPDKCREPSCTPMPLKAASLDPSARDLVRRWIERGAPRD